MHDYKILKLRLSWNVPEFKGTELQTQKWEVACVMDQACLSRHQQSRGVHVGQSYQNSERCTFSKDGSRHFACPAIVRTDLFWGYWRWRTPYALEQGCLEVEEVGCLVHVLFDLYTQYTERHCRTRKLPKTVTQWLVFVHVAGKVLKRGIPCVELHTWKAELLIVVVALKRSEHSNTLLAMFLHSVAVRWWHLVLTHWH